jgi:hypothetical protein
MAFYLNHWSHCHIRSSKKKTPNKTPTMKMERGRRFVGQSAMAYTLSEPLYPRFGPAAQAHICELPKGDNARP